LPNVRPQLARLRFPASASPPPYSPVSNKLTRCLRRTSRCGSRFEDDVWPRPKSPFRPIADAVFFLREGPELTLTFDELEGGLPT
jgi:hypothetical protein